MTKPQRETACSRQLHDARCNGATMTSTTIFLEYIRYKARMRGYNIPPESFADFRAYWLNFGLGE